MSAIQIGSRQTDYLCNALNMGATEENACLIASVPRKVYEQWKVDHPDFAEAVVKIMANPEYPSDCLNNPVTIPKIAKRLKRSLRRRYF